MTPAEQIPDIDRNVVLRRTPEQVADDEQMQADAEKRLSPKVTDSVAVVMYRRAVAMEKTLQDLFRGAEDDRLAECYFWQGKFDEAVKTAATVGKKLEYYEFAKAMTDGRMTQCVCPDLLLRQAGSAKGQRVNPRREIQRVCVGSQDREIVFTRCEACKGVFVGSA